jgi:hypothetical protein
MLIGAAPDGRCPTGKAVHLPASRALAVGEGALCRRLTRVTRTCRCRPAHVPTAAPARHLARAPPPPRAGAVPCRLARAHGGGRDWGGPHGGERRKTRWRKKEDAERPQGEEKKEEGREKKK